MKNFRRPVYIALFLIAATAVWYFGHHRPAQKILKAEPEKVYRTTLFPQNVPPVDSGSPISPAQTSQGTEVEAEAENMHGGRQHSRILHRILKRLPNYWRNWKLPKRGRLSL